MISEPELDSPNEPPDPAREQLVREPESGAARAPRRAWVWTLVGAVAASAAWGGALYALGGGDGAPPLNYRKPVNLCDEARARALSRVLGNLRGSTTRAEAAHPAVDWFSCVLRADGPAPKATDGSGEPGEGWQSVNEVTVTLLRHRVTDPGPEYDADIDRWRWNADWEVKREPVPGLGEDAVMVSGEPLEGPELRVLDGGAVFVMSVTQGWSYSGGQGPTEPEPDTEADETAVQAALIEDMRTLITTLRD
ncbi:hypothetical protein ACWCQL_16945 [Streptomyces sp. NPDC002073]|uniref:hypothetical protein n=1 Tax=Streptomyces sp. NBC_00239 TaxID=2903640 RepID=UPI002E2C46C7|nr:hypothetical protein [Streptomyces sp. NBC_00239]